MLKTEDNIQISAAYYSKESNRRAVILLHMLNNNKESWDQFSNFLLNRRYNSIAIDLRGHGNSVVDGKTWQYFDEKEFNNMKFDVDSAINFLKSKGFSDIVVIGASIGANLALRSAYEKEDVRAAVLLSPGLDYKGILTEDIIGNFKKPLLIITANMDSYSASSSKYLESETKGQKSLRVVQNTNTHGTDLLNNRFGVEDLIINWLNENFR